LLIIFILGFILVWFLSGKIQGILADHDDKTLQAQKLLTDAQVKANAQIAAQVQSDADQLQVLTAKVQVQDAKLIAANAALASALSKQQKLMLPYLYRILRFVGATCTECKSNS